LHWIAEHAYIYPLKKISNKMIYNVWPLQKTLWNIDIHTCLLDSTFLCPHLPSGNTCLLRNKDISIGADLQWKKVYTVAEKRWTMGLRTNFPSIDVINKYANYSAQCISKWGGYPKMSTGKFWLIRHFCPKMSTHWLKVIPKMSTGNFLMLLRIFHELLY
jgi:hypothetical protein